MRYILLLLLTLVYGCGDKDKDSDSSQGIALKGIGSTSAFEQALSPLPIGTELGLFGSLSADNTFHAKNLKYIATEYRLTAESTPINFPNNAESTTIYAYTPYSANMIDENILSLSVNADQSTNGTTSSDIMWGKTVVNKFSGMNTLQMDRKMSLIRINITSASSSDISNAKVELLNVLCDADLSLIDGVLQPTSSTKYTIRAKKVSTGHYEAIILPQSFYEETDFIRITINSKSYLFKVQPKTFEASKAYTFDIKIRDEANYTLLVIYDGKTVGNTLNVPATVADKSLELSSIPFPPPYYHHFKIRNKSGEACWAKIISISSGDPDKYSISDAWGKLRFEENFGTERTMTLEFYNIDSPQDVYKSIVVTQQASSSYLTLSTQSINADRLGSVYDISYEVDVRSNLAWSIENSSSWIDIKYDPANMNQIVLIDVDVNQTGSQRTGTIRFMNNGKEIRAIQVTQSATESSKFTLRYEFNLELTTYGNWFKQNINAYPDIIEIYNYYTSEFGDETAKLYANGTYGFVVDAPLSFNKIIASGMRHDKFLTYRNYNGSAVTIQDLNVSVINNRYRFSFFRSFYIDVPIPSGIKRNQMASFYFKIVDTEHKIKYPKVETDIKIIELQPK